MKKQQMALQEVLLPAASAEKLLMPLKCLACCSSQGHILGPSPLIMHNRYTHIKIIFLMTDFPNDFLKLHKYRFSVKI